MLRLVTKARDLRKSVGLDVNHDKLEFYSPNMGPATLAATASELTVLSLPGAESCVADDGIKILGVPFGSRSFIDKKLKDKTSVTEQMVSLLPGLDDAQKAYLLLRFCCNPRIHHIARSLSPRKFKGVFDGHDAVIRDGFLKIMDIPASDIRSFPLFWDRVGMSTSDGGCGLGWASWAHEAAYVGSMALTFSDVLRRNRGFPLFPREADGLMRLPTWDGGMKTLDGFNNHQPHHKEDQRKRIAELTGYIKKHMQTHQLPRQQYQLSGWMSKQKRRDYLRDDQVSNRGKIIARAAGGSMGGAFLNAIPYDQHHTFQTHDFKRIIRWRLGVPFDFAQHDCPHDHSRRGPCAQDAYGDHLFVCSSSNGDRGDTHDGVRDAIVDYLKSIGLISLPEPSFGMLGITPTNNYYRAVVRRTTSRNSRNMGPDGFVRFGRGDGATYTFDFTHSHPVPSDHNSDRFDVNVYMNNITLAELEKSKIRKYKDIIEQGSVMTPQTKFTPLVTFTYGREGKKFRDFVKFIGATYVHQKFGIDASDDSGMRLRQRVINNIWRRASCAMMRGNCEVLKQGEYRVYHAQRHLCARGVGRASNLLIRPLT